MVSILTLARLDELQLSGLLAYFDELYGPQTTIETPLEQRTPESIQALVGVYSAMAKNMIALEFKKYSINLLQVGNHGTVNQ